MGTLFFLVGCSFFLGGEGGIIFNYAYLRLERVARTEGPHGLEELIVVLEVLVDTGVKP